MHFLLLETYECGWASDVIRSGASAVINDTDQQNQRLIVAYLLAEMNPEYCIRNFAIVYRVSSGSRVCSA